jgi:hypothetical protein
MNKIFSILIICLSAGNTLFPQEQSIRPLPIFKVSFVGGFPYSIPDSTYLFVVEAKICNMTDSICEFFCYSCSITNNMLLESNYLRIARFDCAFNKERHIRLKPGQELTTSVTIIARKEFFENPKNIRIGFVYVGENELRNEDLLSALKRMKKLKQNTIWSNRIDFIVGLGQAINIK